LHQEPFPAIYSFPRPSTLDWETDTCVLLTRKDTVTFSKCQNITDGIFSILAKNSRLEGFLGNSWRYSYPPLFPFFAITHLFFLLLHHQPSQNLCRDIIKIPRRIVRHMLPLMFLRCLCLNNIHFFASLQ